MRHMKSSPPIIPVTILTGFLGSGKTTVLNHLLRQPDLAGTAVIVNEFGEIGIDHLLIESVDERFALLDNGCVCCTIRGDLVATLMEIETRSGTSDLGQLRRVVLETTGLADPAPILHTLMIDPELARRFRIDGVVVTADAVNGSSSMDRHPEAVKQAAVADRILLTKTDLADQRAIAEVMDRLRTLNPTAHIVVVCDGMAAPRDVLGAGDFDGATRPGDFAVRLREAVERAQSMEGRTCGDPGCDRDHHHHPGSRHDDRIRTFAIVVDEPIAWSALSQWLAYFAMIKGENLLRFKGLVAVAESPDRPVVVQGVQNVVHRPQTLDAWPDDDRRTRLVFIVRDLDRALIERTLRKFSGVSFGPAARPTVGGAYQAASAIASAAT